jgi:hypothetical protein
MKSEIYNGAGAKQRKDFETLQLGAFATPDLLLAQRPGRFLTAESGFKLAELRICWIDDNGERWLHRCLGSDELACGELC